MFDKITLDFNVNKGDNSFVQFETVYNLYWKKLYSICNKSLEDPDIAKDLVQDIFISLWEKQEELIINDSLEKYLVKAAKFKVFEYIRNKVGHESKMETLSYYQTLEQTTSSQELVEYKELQENINSAISLLPDHCKKVFLQSRIEGLKNKEIAQALQITERTVEYHITKALAHLRIRLKEYAHLFLF